MKTIIKINSPYFKKNGEPEIRARIANISLNAHAEIKINFKELLEFAGVSSKASLDFFFISSYVYGIDRFVQRHNYSTDGWSRELEVCFPVYEVELWRDVKNELEQTLSFLTGDYWTVSFAKNELDIISAELSNEYCNDAYQQVNLFSGGLDSLIGAIDFLAEPNNINKKILLVSHFDSQMKGPNNDQEKLYNSFPEKYRVRARRVTLAEITLCDTVNIENTEKTFRSRSLLFLGIAVLVADNKKLPIIVAENGSVSLNYPLSASRRGACSTRTTHPTFILNVQSLLAKLSLANSIRNPYEFFTKGEMVNNCGNLELLKSIVHISNSCGKRGHTVNRTDKKSSHCGVCMPCTYRKASLINIDDSTSYGDDLNKLVVGKKNKAFLLSEQGQDLNACFDFLGTVLSRDEIRQELIINGIKDLLKLDKYVDLVVRTRDELKVLVNVNCTISERRNKAGIL